MASAKFTIDVSGEAIHCLRCNAESNGYIPLVRCDKCLQHHCAKVCLHQHTKDGCKPASQAQQQALSRAGLLPDDGGQRR